MCKIDWTSILDISCKIALIAIAIVNLYFVITFFYKKSNADKEDKEKDRKILWLKTLILDNSFKYFHSFFEDLEDHLKQLKTDGLSDEQKKNIDEISADLFIALRRKFTDGLLAVDESLYKKILDSCDLLQTNLTNATFDQGINLSHLPKFNEIISEKLSVTKTEIIRQLFQYRG